MQSYTKLTTGAVFIFAKTTFCGEEPFYNSIIPISGKLGSKDVLVKNSQKGQISNCTKYFFALILRIVCSLIGKPIVSETHK